MINSHNQLNAELMNLKNYVDTPEAQITEGAKLRPNDLLKQWSAFDIEKKSIVDDEMKAYNEFFRSLGIPAVVLPKQPD